MEKLRVTAQAVISPVHFSVNSPRIAVDTVPVFLV